MRVVEKFDSGSFGGIVYYEKFKWWKPSHWFARKLGSR